MSEIKKQALIDSVQADLDAVYKDDQVKPVCTPFSTLGAEMVDKLPSAGSVLVISDLGLLVAVLRKFKAENVTFVAHTPEQEAFAHDLAVKNWQVGYNDPITQLEKHLMGLKFDIIVGNPPYQGTSTGATKDTTHTPKIWGKFVKMSFDYLNEGGYSSLVTPPGWLVPSSKLYDLIFNNTLKFVASGIDGKEVFGAATNAAYFVCQKGKKSSQFSAGIYGQPMSTVQNDGVLLPTVPVEEGTFGILMKTINAPSEKLPIKRVAPRVEAREIQDTVFKHPAFIERKKEAYTEQPLEDALAPKVIIWRILRRHGKCLVPQFAYNETHGIFNYFGGGHTHILLGKDVTREGVESYLNSKVVKFVISVFAQTAHTPIHAIKKLPTVDLTRVWADAELYENFGLTQKEIDLIERTVK